MNSKQRENLRLLLLTALDASKPFAIELPSLRPNLPPLYRSLKDEELRAEIDYLIEKGFAVAAGKVLSPENAQWKITAAGRDFLATEGLA